MDAKDVEPQFAEMVNTRRFPKRSTAFYTPDHPQNPKPGVWYLRHVAFLGAQPPAVKGLRAGKSGFSRTSNPYAPGSEEHVAYDNNWLEGQKAIAAEMGDGSNATH